ncbi:hypothetical protein RO3G_06444 [Rhizopus delemar RA 99-880]|uniref:FHA domain-containing protein n=1 Tax=Rhizopus delemar (strain RA 99-880 / ATCC MYA-4621 / FGSC 9543 / NRRL 43880) TaxID=246409 RepID=I1BZV9_RHIO9|nr:hypothetical protein RO3G_06444 [Rhizopus delemar RA 99-880]|eukprot:EIE81739.1 hypothetical protein RO3G_06444 [Rhizopus delemar RA 99-880]
MSQSVFNDSELFKGYHLITESSHPIKVNTPTILSDRTHLYPRLAGSDWTSYLTQPSIIIGRSGANCKSIPDIDFGNDTKAVSRKHCEIRFSSRRGRWELIIFSRNGVIVNKVMKRPKDRPIVLKTGTLIEINHTSFVFILPSGALRPTEESRPIVNESPEEGDTPNTADEWALDKELENDVIRLFENSESLTTKEILKRLQTDYGRKFIEKDNVMHLLVLSPRFSLAPTSISMSSKESDSIKWMLISQKHSSVCTPGSSTTRSKSFDDEDEADNIPDTPSNEYTEPESSVLFKSISVEHIYSIWIQSSAQEERQNKRTKINHKEGK